MKKKILSILFFTALCFALLTVTASAAVWNTTSTVTEVSYVEYSWDDTTQTLVAETKTTPADVNVTCITGRSNYSALDWGSGWYYVAPGDTTPYTSTRIKVHGTVNLILGDGCKLDAAGGINVSTGTTLNIYAQSANSGNLVARLQNTNEFSCAAIGGDNYKDCGTVNIHGGQIQATGHQAAGIGGGANGGKGGTVNIYSGVVNASGNSFAAGIGGGGRANNSDNGAGGSSGTTTIYGGIVYASAYGQAYAIGAGYGKNGGLGVHTPPVLKGGLVYQKGSGEFGGTSYTLETDLTLGNTLNIAAGQTLIIPAGKTLTLNGTINNSGTIENHGTLLVKGTLNNNDSGQLTTDGTLTVNGTLTNNENATVTSSGAVTVNGTLNNGGTFTNSATTTVSASGRMSNNGTFTNSGSGKLVIETANLLSGSGTLSGDTASFWLKKMLADDITTEVNGVDCATTAPTYTGQPQTVTSTMKTQANILGTMFQLLDSANWDFCVLSADQTELSDKTVTNAGTYYVKWYDTTDDTVSVQRAFEVQKAQRSVTAANITCTYGDTGKSVTATTTGDSSFSYAVTEHPEVVSVNSSGNLNILKAGTAKVKITAAENDNYKEAETTITVTVNKALSDIQITDMTVTYGETDKSVVPTIVGDGTVSYAVANGGDVVQIDSTSGRLTLLKSGTATVLVQIAEGTNYLSSSTTMQVTVNRAVVTIEAGDVSGIYGDTDKCITATKNGDGTLSYAVTAGQNVVQVNAATGALTFLRAGSATVQVASSETDCYSTATKSVNITVGKATVIITALDQTATAGEKEPDLSAPEEGTHYTLSGLLGEDRLQDTVTIKLSFDATLDMKKDGEYPIIPSVEGEDTRYQFEFVPGILTLNPRNATRYAVTAQQPKNGSLSLSSGTGVHGTTITVTATPNAGYVLDKLTVTDEKGNRLKLTDLGNGRYTFRLLYSDVTVSATFTRSAEASFADVPEKAYYADAVAWALQNGITGGVNATHFAPDQPCTRAQIVTFLWRAAGCPEPKTTATFTDVPAGAYYAKAVAWAVENDLTGGVGNNQFAPDVPCTRAQTVAFLFRYAVASGMEAVTLQELVSGYTDAQAVPPYAVSAFNWALASGVMTGSNGTLAPNAECTRAQIVTMLYRLTQR